MDYTIFNFAWDMVANNAPTVFAVAVAFAVMHWGFGRITNRIDNRRKY